MKYSITYTSSTGNTALLAERLRTILPTEQCIYYGSPDQEAPQGDVIFAGFWTDKGTCSDELASFLQTLRDKKIFLFGTAGFGGTEEYFTQILDRVGAHLDQSNTLIGTYMCQGKMPMSVRGRYEAMATDSPDKARSLMENFDRALSHPDADDLNRLEHLIAGIKWS